MECFPRILVLSPTPTWPLDHGNRKRVYSVCKALQNNGADIDFLYYPAEHDWRRNIPIGALEKMRQQWGAVFVVPPTRPLHTGAKGLDHTIDEWWDPAIGSYLDWLFSLKEYDALIVNYTWLSRAMTHAPRGTFNVLDTHDRFAGRRELLASFGIGPEFFHTTDAEEKIAFDRANLVLAIKSQEEDIFQRVTSTPVRTLPHMEVGLEATSEAQPVSTRRYLSVGTIGANNSINVINLQRFLDVAVPIFTKYMAPLKIVIAGGQCDSIENRYPDAFVELLGRVADVGDFYDSIDTVIAPMEFSTGLKIKVCEALTRGIPVVSHKHAFEGYPPCHPAHECEDFEEMAMHLVRLAFAPEGLNELRSASVASSQQTERQFTAGLRSIIRGATIQRTTLVMVIPAGFSARSSYIHQGIMSAVRYLRYAARLVFYLPPHSKISDVLAKQELLPLGSVIREEEGYGQLLTLRTTTPLCAALYWDLPNEGELEALGQTPIWMRSDAVDSTGHPLPENAIVAQLRGRPMLSILDCAEDRAIRIATRLQATPRVIPFFYEALVVQVPRKGAVLFCNEGQMALVRAVVDLLKSELPHDEVVTVCVAAANCCIPEPEWEGVLLATVHSDFGRTPVNVRVLIDVTGGDAVFALVRETLFRHKVPEVRLSPTPGLQVARWDRPRTTTELLAAIKTAFSPIGANRREHVNDEGWAQLWQQAVRANNAASLI
ncbi:hypothetical protein GGE65_000764 [Skermanella aerolata]|uniref:glycosyltransferase n=1 Tax=Skermanella aerolata TaxID=393310 RepID=UPI003D23C469